MNAFFPHSIIKLYYSRDNRKSVENIINAVISEVNEMNVTHEPH